MKNNQLKIGIMFVVLAAFGGSFGQFAWKIGAESSSTTLAMIWYAVGFLISGIGMILLMISFRYGDVSILQPMMSISYIISIILGTLILGEPITITKIIGTALIMGAAILLGREDGKKVAGEQ